MEKTLRILIIDDTPEDRVLYIRVLRGVKDREFDIIEADTAEDGIRLARELSPDCILLDFNLPDLNGLELLEEFQDDEIEGNSAIIMLTGSGNEKVAAKAIQAGAADYLLKGEVNTNNLIKAIDHAIQHDEMKREIKEARRVERHFAFHDHLTGLPNRMLVGDRIQQSIVNAERQGKQVAVLYIDLDGFKVINDTMGHYAGDQVLVHAAKTLQGCIRKTDTAARLGGDEFVVIAVINEERDALNIANKILKNVTRKDIHLSCSIGVSLFPRDGWEAEVLIRNADMAMYRTKKAGKNGINFFSYTMGSGSDDTLTLYRDLPRAVEKNQLSLLYQPIIDLRSGEIISVEALVRWQHPKLGLIPAQKFIPIAEEVGMIADIDRWVLRHACRQLQHGLAEEFKDVRLAINLSTQQLRDPELREHINSALSESGFSAERLCLEITEYGMMVNVKATSQVLTALKEMGVSLAVDDFGTGYSSLSYLKDFPVDFLKIDRSFVTDIPGDPQNEKICTAVVALAKSLDLKAIAEGIENPEQAYFFRQRNCDAFQGYWASKPIPLDQLKSLLETGLVLKMPQVDEEAEIRLY